MEKKNKLDKNIVPLQTFQTNKTDPIKILLVLIKKSEDSGLTPRRNRISGPRIENRDLVSYFRGTLLHSFHQIRELIIESLKTF